jgi:isoleucyl-tRNA synthetase
LAEKLYQILTEGMKGVPQSVHLCSMPAKNALLRDEALEARMVLLGRIIGQGRGLRQKHKLKVRQVLPALTVITRRQSDRSVIEEEAALLKSELNVKALVFTTEETKHVRLVLKPNLRTLGARIGGKLKEVAAHLAKLNGDASSTAAIVSELEKGQKVDVLGNALGEEDFLIERFSLDESLIATEKGVTILLDTRLTPELIAEGLAREIVNRVQNLRKDSGLAVSDRIRLQISASGALADSVKLFDEYIMGETLSKKLDVTNEKPSLKFVETYQIDEMDCIIGLEVISS